MDPCETTLTTISQLLDHEPAAPAAQRAAKAHLATCADCRAVAHEMRQLDAMMREAPMRYAPSGFTERAVAAAMAADQARNRLLGFGALGLSILTMAGLLLAGQRDLLWLVLATVLTPGFSGQAWLREAVEGSFVFLGVVAELLVGPLFVPLTLPLLLFFVALLVWEWRHRQRMNALH